MQDRLQKIQAAEMERAKNGRALDVFDGIFHPETNQIFKDFISYKTWYEKRRKVVNGMYVGLLTHRHNYVTENLGAEHALIAKLEDLGYPVIPVFSYSSSEEGGISKNFREVTQTYFCLEGRFLPEGIVNFQMMAALGNNSSCTQKNSFDQITSFFAALNVPVFRPLISYLTTKEEWERSYQGLSLEIPHGFTVNEMMGMIEPILIGCRSKEGITEVIEERVEKFCFRLDAWMKLRKAANSQKRIVFMIHSAPCSGVEATVGNGLGLQVFQSMVGIMKHLQEEGYRIENIPESGEALRKMVFEKKAIQDFRWTSVNCIVESGGSIYSMPLEIYERFFEELPQKSQEQMKKTWGAPPGEAMTYEGNLVITGLQFGNILLMVQPKRGCYGAKCTGEVCKMLHDPLCPPTHQYVATYRYIEKIFQAHALVHVGTDGSLEHLPGKSNALSQYCWPDIVLGNLPNLYIYNAGAGTEGTQSKRRSQAVILDHLPGAIGLPMETKVQMDFSMIHPPVLWGKASRLHIFGQDPPFADVIMHLYEEAQGSGANCREEEIFQGIFDKRRLPESMEEETNALLRSLRGGYVSAGPAGTAYDGLDQILPTGRNFHTMSVEKVPTKEAYQLGVEVANALLEKYRKEKGALPEKIAVNMISTDITGTKGEQLSMVLYLYGVRPVWENNGKVSGLEVISLAELGRARIDVMVRISGVLRDAYPTVVNLMDRGALLVAGLQEEDENNYIRKHTQEMMQKLQEKGDRQELWRRSATRIFGDKPGTYGVGVNIALKAGAWESEEDLAKIFIEFSSYAYGEGLQGESFKKELVENILESNVSMESSASRRHDLLSSGFAAAVHGGILQVKEVISGETMEQYHCNTGEKTRRIVSTIREEGQKILAETILDETWKEQIKASGYEGVTECMRRVQTIFDWQCTSETFRDEDLDEATKSILLDRSFLDFIEKENPYGAEEISRRLMELVQRGKWRPDPDVFTELKKVYLHIEGKMESQTQDLGDYQGSAIEILAPNDVEEWKEKLEDTQRLIEEYKQNPNRPEQ